MPTTLPPQLVLASSSPYRRELLERLRLRFDVLAPHIDEAPLPGEAPHELAMRLAQAKAMTVAQLRPGTLVIGSDQVALCAGRILGKPGDFENAVAQLRHMSGRDVTFHTALAVTDGLRVERENVITQCRLRTLDDAAIRRYLWAEEPFDTAGSAKAESLGIALMEHIRSDDPTALIGLPLIALTRVLTRFDLDPLGAGQ